LPWCPCCKSRSRCNCGVGLVDEHGPVVGRLDRYDSLFQYYARQYDLDWQLIKRQAMAESSLDPKAKSPAGAVGLMQFMPATWAEWGEGDPYDPEASIRAGCRYMSHLYGCYGEIPDAEERYRFALAAYNWGRGNVNGALTKVRGCTYAEWEAQGRPPGPWQIWTSVAKYMPTETQNYVRRILPPGE